MSTHKISIPHCPAALANLLRIAPLVPVSLSLTACSRRIAKNHPGLFQRLGKYGCGRFLLNPTDLPIVLCLDPNDGAPRVRALRKPCQGTVKISGPLAALLGLVHGAYDGDALFFSRDLVIEGDTAAALAMRNAIDDAELDITEEIVAISGPFAQPFKHIVNIAERRSGVYLTRQEEATEW